VRDPHQPDATWRDGMSRLGELENIFCKVSGLVEPVKGPSGSAPTAPDYYRPTLDHVARSFGPQRLLFGSNWPVSDKGADFAGVFRVVSRYFADRPAAEREDFYWRNARRAYRWTERS
jgi:predicted TIM-barrel fold metal-dependent hydrolase